MSSDPTPTAPCEPEKPSCCKCEAYREIVQENARRIAVLTESLEKCRQWSGFTLREVEGSIGKKP